MKKVIFGKKAKNLVEMLEETSARYPKKVSLSFGSKKITYRELLLFSKKLASALAALGVKESKRVAIWLPNCPEFVYSFFAALRLAATVVPINSMFKEEEARFIVEDSAAEVLISSIDKAEESEIILSRVRALKYVISLPSPKKTTPLLDFYALVNRAGEFNGTIATAEDAVAEIVYTSGTTGTPKGACLSHSNLLCNIRDCTEAIRANRRDCFICFLPLFHSFASTVCMLLPIYNGSKTVIMRAVKPFKRLIRTVFRRRVTVFVGIPSIYSILNELKLSRRQAFLNRILNPVRLCISGAAALPVTICNKFERKFRRPLLQGYGLTEASPVVALNPLRGVRRPDSVGVPLATVEVKVVDRQGKELPCGGIGELLVKGKNVMQGYYNLEKETRTVLEDGWLRTGDLARVDEQGFVFIIGRLKEMINVRGLNVYPREIEELLYKHPKIREAAVVGVSHRHRGEAPVAFAVKDGETEEREILHYLRRNLASYKVPLRVFFKHSLAKNSTGKIIKKELEAEAAGIFER